MRYFFCFDYILQTKKAFQFCTRHLSVRTYTTYKFCSKHILTYKYSNTSRYIITNFEYCLRIFFLFLAFDVCLFWLLAFLSWNKYISLIKACLYEAEKWDLMELYSSYILFLLLVVVWYVPFHIYFCCCHFFCHFVVPCYIIPTMFHIFLLLFSFIFCYI